MGEIYITWYSPSCSNIDYKIIDFNVNYTPVSGIDIVTDDSCRPYFGGVQKKALFNQLLPEVESIRQQLYILLQASVPAAKDNSFQIFGN